MFVWQKNGTFTKPFSWFKIWLGKSTIYVKNCFKNEWTFTNRIKPLHLFKFFRPWISEALDRVCKMEFYAVWYISLRTILVDRNPLKFHDQFYTWWLLRLHFAEEGPNSLCVFIVQLSATGLSLLLKTGSDKIIYWLSRYSFLLGFIMSKKLGFYIVIKSSVWNLSRFLDMIIRRKEYLLSR